MSGVLHTPRAGDELSASWMRDLVDEIRSARLSVMAPLVLTRTPSGTSLRIKNSGSGAAADPAQPWDVSFSANSATFTDCCLKRATVTRFFTIPVYTMPELAECYIGYRYNMSSGAVEIIAGAAVTDVSYDTADGSAEWDRTLLYKCKRAGDSSGWRVVCDYRRMPAAMLYI